MIQLQSPSAVWYQAHLITLLQSLCVYLDKLWHIPASVNGICYIHPAGSTCSQAIRETSWPSQSSKRNQQIKLQWCHCLPWGDENPIPGGTQHQPIDNRGVRQGAGCPHLQSSFQPRVSTFSSSNSDFPQQGKLWVDEASKLRMNSGCSWIKPLLQSTSTYRVCLQNPHKGNDLGGWLWGIRRILLTCTNYRKGKIKTKTKPRSSRHFLSELRQFC